MGGKHATDSQFPISKNITSGTMNGTDARGEEKEANDVVNVEPAMRMNGTALFCLAYARFTRNTRQTALGENHF